MNTNRVKAVKKTLANLDVKVTENFSHRIDVLVMGAFLKIRTHKLKEATRHNEAFKKGAYKQPIVIVPESLLLSLKSLDGISDGSNIHLLTPNI